jgi:hypothetical protein
VLTEARENRDDALARYETEQRWQLIAAITCFALVASALGAMVWWGI